MKYLCCFFVFVFFISCDESENIKIEPVPGDVEIIAHGGASAYEPFNSILSFKKAFELNADAIELDLMNSKDDSLMVFHDLNTKKITGIDYNVVDTHSKILRTLDIGKGERMPYLYEIFEILPKDKKIYLEVKWWQDVNAKNNKHLITILLDQIEKSGRANDCVIMCFSLEFLIKLKSINPKINLFWINNDIIMSKTAADTLIKYNFKGVNALWSMIDNDFANSLKYNNKLNYAWTVDDGNLVISLYQKFKIDGVFTNKPDVIRMELSKIIKF